jgi:hypothetical protein
METARKSRYIEKTIFRFHRLSHRDSKSGPQDHSPDFGRESGSEIVWPRLSVVRTLMTATDRMMHFDRFAPDGFWRLSWSEF